jgi:hypothetical protein
LFVAISEIRSAKKGGGQTTAAASFFLSKRWSRDQKNRGYPNNAKRKPGRALP